MLVPVQKVRQWMPPSVKRLLRRPLRIVRRSFRALKLRTARRVTKEELVHDLYGMGLRHGDAVIVYSSLSRLGFVIGGAPVVVEALLQVVGPKGLVVMPAFVGGSRLEYLATDPLFDPQQTPSHTGRITEVFRLWPGAERSIHPTHSVVAIGRRAKELVQDHFRSVTPFGPHTPFVRLLEQDAWALCLGVDVRPITFYHTFEDMMGEQFPLPVYYPELQRARVLIEGGEQEVWTKVHDPELTGFRIDSDQRIRAVVTEKLLESGFLYRGKVGDGLSYIIKAKHLITALERMLSSGITIYNTERMHREGWQLPTGLATEF